jgi:hypothetical protein
MLKCKLSCFVCLYILILSIPFDARGISLSSYGITLTGGVQTTKYDQINSRLNEYHNLELKENLHPIGLGVFYSLKNILFSGHYFFSTTDKTSETMGHKLNVNSKRHTLSLGFGVDLLSSSHMKLYPYIGPSLTILKMSTDFPYNTRCPDCFFQGTETYTNKVFGGEFGISFQVDLPRKPRGIAPFFGVSLACVIARKNTHWDAGGSAPNPPAFDANSILFTLIIGLSIN